MSHNLFLDDERYPEDVTWVDIGPGPWTIVRGQHEFIQHILREGLPAKISFDNDLGENNGEGRFCVNWIIESVLDGQIIYRQFNYTVHSMNNIAAEDIRSKLNAFFAHMEERNR